MQIKVILFFIRGSLQAVRLTTKFRHLVQ